MTQSDNNLDIEELHSVQLSILREFDRVCRKNNIQYSVAYGTLIGAIRHQGFIPWDDDIDVLVPYKDYIRLSQLPKNEFNDLFFLQSSDTDPEYNKCFFRLRKSDTTLINIDDVNQDINHGVCIDIYPLIHLADGKLQRRVQYAKSMMYMLLQENHIPVNHKRIFKVGAAILLFVIPNSQKEKIKKRMILGFTKYENRQTVNSYNICGRYTTMLKSFKTEWFSSYIDRKFEDMVVPVPQGYDAFLKSFYGDYMKIPEVDQQGLKLDQFVKFDAHTPFSEFKGSLYCINR